MNRPTLPADVARFEPVFQKPPGRRKTEAPSGTTGTSLADPLTAVETISSLINRGRNHGFQIDISSDFEELQRTRREVRGDEVSPMFDPAVSILNTERAFWIAARLHSGRVIALQAFRLDIVHPSSAEWALGWMAGLYIKRNELVLPRLVDAPRNTEAHLLSGKLVYHGELWIDRHIRSNHCFDVFPRLGMLLAYVKWTPRALWALVNEGMATRGHMVRMGYGKLERDFFTWEWEPEGADASEWIAIAENAQLEYLIADGSRG